MAEIKDDDKTKEIQAPAKSITPQISNVTAVYNHPDFVIIDFGFAAPSYIEKADYLEDTQIARICLPWDSIEDLAKSLNSILKGRTKPNKKKTGKSSID